MAKHTTQQSERTHLLIGLAYCAQSTSHIITFSAHWAQTQHIHQIEHSRKLNSWTHPILPNLEADRFGSQIKRLQTQASKENPRSLARLQSQTIETVFNLGQHTAYRLSQPQISLNDSEPIMREIQVQQRDSRQIIGISLWQLTSLELTYLLLVRFNLEKKEIPRNATKNQTNNKRKAQSSSNMLPYIELVVKSSTNNLLRKGQQRRGWLLRAQNSAYSKLLASERRRNGKRFFVEQ